MSGHILTPPLPSKKGLSAMVAVISVAKTYVCVLMCEGNLRQQPQILSAVLEEGECFWELKQDWRILFQLVCGGEEPVGLQEWKSEQKQKHDQRSSLQNASERRRRRRKEDLSRRRDELGSVSEAVYSADHQRKQTFLRGETERRELFSPQG